MVYQNGPKILASGPTRPLTRMFARARSASGGKRNKSANGNNMPLQDDAYSMEVNEYISNLNSSSGGGANSASSRPIPCVTVRDMNTFIPDKKQRRVWIPVAVCDELVKVLRACRDNEKGTYDVSKLPETIFHCPVTKKVVEIERVEENTRLRTYMDAPDKERYKQGDLIEVIGLRNELMHRLINFLCDVATRYRRINAQMSIPSLYSYSAERRYYYDLRETRWGLRLHISQVTDLHRNVIGIPLESVTAFRDRLNLVIQFLGLENGTSESEDGNSTGINGINKALNNTAGGAVGGGHNTNPNGRRVRNKRNTKNGKQKRSKSKNLNGTAAEGSGDKKTDLSDETNDDKPTSKGANTAANKEKKNKSSSSSQDNNDELLALKLKNNEQASVEVAEGEDNNSVVSSN